MRRMPTLPNLRQLAYLAELSERLNFRVAAEAQFVTQPVGEDVVARARELPAAARAPPGT